MSNDKYTYYFKKGDVIYREGDPGESAFLIDSGEVALYADEGSELLAKVSEGEIFGEMSTINNTTRVTTAVATKNTKCSVVSQEQLNERINDSDPVVQLLITNFMNRLRSNFNKSFKDADKTKISDIKSQGMDFMSQDKKTDKEVAEKIRFETSLKQAIDDGSYSMHFQPIIDMNTQNIVGLEALVRSLKLDDNSINPDIFMGIAEETSLIIPLGRWIIRNACKEFNTLMTTLKKYSEDVSDIFVSINVSARQMGDEQFFDILRESTWGNKVKPKNIKIEITERVLANGDTVFNWIKKIRSLGYSVALDDFGTGYSSLGVLGQLDFNNIKIDKSFVQSMKSNSRMKTIVKSIIDMATGMGRTVIAEGIETEEQYKTLQEMGCQYGQGYLFARPMPIEDIIDHMTGGKKKAAA